MKYHVKAIHYKRSEPKGDVESPCLSCTQGECLGVRCETLRALMRSCESVSVEFEQGHGGVMLARIICRTLSWIAVVAAITFACLKLKGV